MVQRASQLCGKSFLGRRTRKCKCLLPKSQAPPPSHSPSTNRMAIFVAHAALLLVMTRSHWVASFAHSQPASLDAIPPSCPLTHVTGLCSIPISSNEAVSKPLNWKGYLPTLEHLFGTCCLIALHGWMAHYHVFEPAPTCLSSPVPIKWTWGRGFILSASYAPEA